MGLNREWPGRGFHKPRTSSKRGRTRETRASSSTMNDFRLINDYLDSRKPGSTRVLGDGMSANVSVAGEQVGFTLVKRMKKRKDLASPASAMESGLS